MTATATVALQALITGTPGGNSNVSLTGSSSDANWTVNSYVLAAGDNNILLPTSPVPTGVIIVLPSNNTSVTTLMGFTGDVGIPIKKTGWLHLQFDSASLPTYLVLNSVSTQTNKLTYVYFY